MDMTAEQGNWTRRFHAFYVWFTKLVIYSTANMWTGSFKKFTLPVCRLSLTHFPPHFLTIFHLQSFTPSVVIFVINLDANLCSSTISQKLKLSIRSSIYRPCVTPVFIHSNLLPRHCFLMSLDRLLRRKV